MQMILRQDLLAGQVLTYPASLIIVFYSESQSFNNCNNAGQTDVIQVNWGCFSSGSPRKRDSLWSWYCLCLCFDDLGCVTRSSLQLWDIFTYVYGLF